jgi:phospholipid-translocating ATPase
MLEDNCAKHNGPMGDSLDPGDQSARNKAGKQTSKGGKRREQNYVVRDLITCLALCHNVTPTYPDPDDPTCREFQASSPDEIALVKFADNQLGMKLLERDQQKIVIQNTNGVKEVRLPC